jgi:hypothetical protein
MAYSDDIDALNPDHRWSLSANSTDGVGSVDGTDTSIVYTGTALCEGATNSAQTNAFTDRITFATTTNINNSAQTRKVVCGWFMVDSIQPHPCRIYGEGTNTLCYQIVMAFGNNLMLEVVDSSFTLQVYGPALVPNRAYHVCTVFEGNAYSNEIKLFVDGVEQFNASPTNRQPGTATLTARGQAIIADPSGTVGIGGDAVLLQAALNGHYNEWATFDGANAVLTDTEIREELFEKGALPDLTIATGTESAMQTAVDAYNSTTRSNAPVCMRVNDVTGGGDLYLSSPNIQFDELASVHIQWMGTGTLTWSNTESPGATIASTPNGGTVVFENPATLSLLNLPMGCEVRIYDDEIADPLNFDTELAGTEEALGYFSYDHSGATNEVVIQVIADGYEEVLQRITVGSEDLSLDLIFVLEENL